MEIGHGFASGAVIGRVTTQSWGRQLLRAAQSRAIPLDYGDVVNDASWRTTVVSSFSYIADTNCVSNILSI